MTFYDIDVCLRTFSKNMSRNIIDQHMTKKILILSGDGVGPEIIAQAEKILSFLNTESQLGIQLDHFTLDIQYRRTTGTGTRVLSLDSIKSMIILVISIQTRWSSLRILYNTA